MKSVVLSLGTILTGLGLLSIGNGLLSIVVPTKAYLLGIGQFQIGLMTTAYYGGFLLGCFRTTSVVSRIGHIRSFAVFAASLCLLTLSFSFVSSSFAWIALRAAIGFCVAGIYMIAESWVNEFASNQNRGRILSMYRMIDLAALMSGQLLMGHVPLDGNLVFVIAASFINLGLIPVAMTRQAGPAPISDVKLNIRQLIKTSHIGSIGCLIVGLVNGSIWALGPVYAAAIDGFGPQKIAQFMALIVLSGAVFQIGIGFLADRMNRAALMTMVALLAACTGYYLYQLGTDNAAKDAYFVGALLFGGFAMPMYSLTMAITNDRAQKGEFVQIGGGLLLLYSIGAIVGPMLSSLTMKYLGARGLFGFTAATHGLLGVYVGYRTSIIKHPPARETFVSPPRTTPVIFNIDPRADTDEPSDKAVSGREN
jgi:MFS family permease